MHSEACLYTLTPDNDFILDTIDGVIVCGGDSGHAFKFGPLLGRLVADLAQGQAAAAGGGAVSGREVGAIAELIDHDAWEIAAAVRTGEVSAVEIAEQSLARLEADTLGAVWVVTRERALAEAEAVDAALAAGRDPGPLAGVPVGWKDLIETAGIRTTYGSAIYADHVPERDADVVARHTAAGAVCVAKLATHEFAWSTTTQNPHFGGCQNPHDPTRVPGGSSGGSGGRRGRGHGAARTRHRHRRLDPLPGLVLRDRRAQADLRPGQPGRDPPAVLALDHCGPMARSVRDCALSLEVMAGPSVRDPRTQPVPVERYRDALDQSVGA